MSEGYLFCVGGRDLYYKLLKRAIGLLRNFDKERPICVVTDDIEKAKLYSDFENILYRHFEIEKHIVPTVNPDISWHRYGFYPKVFQFLYTPFDRTMFFDVDSKFLTDFTFFWDEFKSSGSPFQICGLSDQNNCSPRDWHWGHIYDVILRSNIRAPQVSSSFFIYDKSVIHPFLPQIQMILSNLEKWHCRSIFEGGYPDEIVFSLLIGMFNIRPNEKMFHWLHDPTKILCCDKNI